MEATTKTSDREGEVALREKTIKHKHTENTNSPSANEAATKNYKMHKEI